MSVKIGIRREDINQWERRVPLIPSHARELVERHGLDIRIQPSEIRVFRDTDYRAAGIPVEESLSPCGLVLALKEIPLDLIERGKTYVFFSHTAKGQSQNMPMLKRMMELGCTIVDYEKMVDDKGRRVLYFGNYAGHAGMIDTLWALGRRLEEEEGLANPFTILEPTHRYASLAEAKEAVGRLAWRIIRQGLPKELGTVVFGFLGYGHVSQGAQEVFDMLPVETVHPSEVRPLVERGGDPGRLYKAVFKEEDMVRPVEPGKSFDLQDYYGRPEGYRPVVEDYVPALTAIVNGVYWTPKYPKFITKGFLRRLYGAGPLPRLRVIGDITCDVNGSLECTVQATDPENPVYVYDPIEDKARMGFRGRGPVVLAVYNLPAELPLEASTYFSGKLKELVPAMAAADLGADWRDCRLPDVVRRAVIVYRGRLTPDYAYLQSFLA